MNRSHTQQWQREKEAEKHIDPFQRSLAWPFLSSQLLPQSWQCEIPLELGAQQPSCNTHTSLTGTSYLTGIIVLVWVLR